MLPLGLLEPSPFCFAFFTVCTVATGHVVTLRALATIDVGLEGERRRGTSTWHGYEHRWHAVEEIETVSLNRTLKIHASSTPPRSILFFPWGDESLFSFPVFCFSFQLQSQMPSVGHCFLSYHTLPSVSIWENFLQVHRNCSFVLSSSQPC